jgi:hypothetical protein
MKTLSNKNFCFYCMRHRDILIFCETHEQYHCYKCECFECMPDEQKILFYEKQINRLNENIYSYIIDLNILRNKINEHIK